MDGIMLEQVGEGLVVGDIVHSYEIEAGFMLFGSAEDIPSDTSKSIDCNTSGHSQSSQQTFSIERSRIG